MTASQHDDLERACRAVHQLAQGVAREGLRALNGCGWLMVEKPAREWIIRNPQSFGDLVQVCKRELREGSVQP